MYNIDDFEDFKKAMKSIIKNQSPKMFVCTPLSQAGKDALNEAALKFARRNGLKKEDEKSWLDLQEEKFKKDFVQDTIDICLAGDFSNKELTSNIIKARRGGLNDSAQHYFLIENLIMENLKHYIGVKEIDATPMTLGEYNEYRGWKLPADEYPETEGYFVVYPDGYKSWSPKKQFEDAYFEVRPGQVTAEEVLDSAIDFAAEYPRIKNFTFGKAIDYLKAGACVARFGWNGRGMFVMKQIPAEIGLDIIPKMQSVQNSAKEQLLKREVSLKYENQMLIIKPDGTADSWVPSSSDIFATDWYVSAAALDKLPG